MKKNILTFSTCLFLGINFITPILGAQQFTSNEPVIIQQGENPIIFEQQPITNEKSQSLNIIFSDFFVDLNHLYQYNIIALNDADINCHVRGSIWVGGNLTGNQYIDDGSLNGLAASDSYVYFNLSSLNFKSRTEFQSPDAFFHLTDTAVINGTQYWTSMLENFPNNKNFIYLPPDEDGYVDLKYWDYQANGGDSAQASFPIVYYTDATLVQMGGLAGHLIAPFADIYIVSCNHCGSIVGNNIYTDGESHINYWTPDLKSIETAQLSITKTLALNNFEQTLLFSKDSVSYYVALFEDADCTIMIPQTEKEIVFNQNAISTITYENLESEKTYYFCETDGFGNKLESNDFMTISYDEGNEIYLVEDQSISFKNLFTELPDGYFTLTPTPAPTFTPTPTNTPVPTNTPIPFHPEPVDTEDSAKTLTFAMLALLAILVIYIIYLKKNEK